MRRIYMIGNTHFDPAWLWTWDEAMASIRATFRSALERLTEYDGIGGSVKLKFGENEAVDVRLSPYEIKTLRFLKDGSVRETNMLEDLTT